MKRIKHLRKRKTLCKNKNLYCCERKEVLYEEDNEDKI